MEMKNSIVTNKWRGLLETFLSNKVGLFGAIVLGFFIIIAIFGPFLSDYNPKDYGVGEVLSPPSFENLLGTDDLGRDVLGGVILGARISITVGVLAT